MEILFCIAGVSSDLYHRERISTPYQSVDRGSRNQLYERVALKKYSIVLQGFRVTSTTGGTYINTIPSSMSFSLQLALYYQISNKINLTLEIFPSLYFSLMIKK
jgi:hypothetical protein